MPHTTRVSSSFGSDYGLCLRTCKGGQESAGPSLSGPEAGQGLEHLRAPVPLQGWGGGDRGSHHPGLSQWPLGPCFSVPAPRQACGHLLRIRVRPGLEPGIFLSVQSGNPTQGDKGSLPELQGESLSSQVSRPPHQSLNLNVKVLGPSWSPPRPPLTIPTLQACCQQVSSFPGHSLPWASE